jgi:uncharacterized protein
MPTNLPPECTKIEEAYREARDLGEKIRLLEELIACIPKHKGTDHLRADLRRRLSKLQDQSASGKGKARVVSPYHIDREGAGQVVLIGPPNVGKSALVATLTNSSPEVSASPFSTWEPTPGMMPVYDTQVQLIDTPPLNPDYIEHDLMDLVRRADLVLLMVDVQADPLGQLEESLALLKEYRIVPDLRRDEAEDPYRWAVVPMLVVVNKVDDEDADVLLEIMQELMEEPWLLLPISVETGRGIDAFKAAVFEALGVVRVYSKPPGQPPDMSVPFVLRQGATVEELAGRVHKEILERLTAARVWGSAEHDGQMVGRDHVLQDGDIVELRT